MNKRKGVRVTKAGTKKAQKKTAPLVNLNGPDSDEEASGIEGDKDMTTKEKEAAMILKKHLHPCELSDCHNLRCKINKDGKHVEISWNKLSAWAQALVSLISIILFQFTSSL